jgi:hypothetical protein
MFATARILLLGSLFLIPFTLELPYGVIRLYTVDLAIVPLLVVVLLLLLFTPRRVRFHWVITDTFVLSLFIAITLSLLFSDDRTLSLPNFADWIRCIVVYGMSRMLFENEIITARQLQASFIAVGLLLVMIGLVQLVTGTKFGLIGNYFGLSREQGSSAMIGRFVVVSRISGTTSNANIYVMWVNLFFGMAVAWCLVTRRYLLFFAAAAIGSVVVIGTLARGGAAAFAMFLLILALRNFRRLLDVRAVLIGALAIPLMLGVILLGPAAVQVELQDLVSYFDDRLQQVESEQHGIQRLLAVEIGLNLVISDMKIFLVGTGAENFPNALIIHNMWVRLLAEHGVLTVAMIFGVAVALIGVIRGYEASRTFEAHLWTQYASAMLLSFVVVSSQVYHTAGSYNLLLPLSVLTAFLVSRRMRLATGGAFPRHVQVRTSARPTSITAVT